MLLFSNNAQKAFICALVIIFTTGFLFFDNSEEINKKLEELSSSAILKAELLTYKELKDDEKAKVGENNKYGSWYYINSWRSGDGHGFDYKKSHYVRLDIKNYNLAYLTFFYSGGSILSRQRLSDDDLENKIQETLKGNPYLLYGKYQNKWQLFDEMGKEIPNTAKFVGFNTVHIKRNNDVDYVLLGPIPFKPKKLHITISNNITSDDIILPNPEVALN